MTRIGSARRLAVALLTVVAVAACTAEDESTTTEGTPAPGDVEVEVTLDEFTIDLPESISAGTVSFEIANEGDMEHSFAIEGPGVEEGAELDAPLGATATDTFAVELQPGTYTVWCPIGDHRERGMEATIEVTEGPAGSGGAPLGDEGITPSEQEAPITDDYSAP
jgi:plastocyanin